MIKEFHAEFIERIERTPSVCSFRFKPQSPLDFIPGQFAQIIFDEKDKANRNLNKYLSFSCRPQKDCVEFTKRISSSDFSKRLLALQKGDRLLFKGPMGNCALDNDRDKCAFLIGGIGITPVISILEHIVSKKLPTDVVLLYSNASDADIPFYQELDQWARCAPNIKIVYIVGSCASKDEKYRAPLEKDTDFVGVWVPFRTDDCSAPPLEQIVGNRGSLTGFIGMISKDLVLSQIPDHQNRTFYIFGPPKMVGAMVAICQAIGCASERIKAENFVGYE